MKVVPFIGLAACFLVVCFGCRCSNQAHKDAPQKLPVVYQAFSDTLCPFYVKTNKFPHNRKELAIGLLGSNPSCDSLLLATFLQADYFDNITGQPLPDGICDFAGENFLYHRYVPDSSFLSDSIITFRQQAICETALLIRPTVSLEATKVVVVACDAAAQLAQKDMRDLLEDARLHIPSTSTLWTGIRTTEQWLEEKPGTLGIFASPQAVALKSYQSLLSYDNTFLQQYDTTNTPIPKELIPVFHFDFSQGNMQYKGSRYNPTYIYIRSEANYVRYFTVMLVEQLRHGNTRKPLTYLLLGDISLVPYTAVITETLRQLRDYRKEGRYVYRHLISPQVTLIDPARETAIETYRLLLQDKTPAYRPTRGVIRNK